MDQNPYHQNRNCLLVIVLAICINLIKGITFDLIFNATMGTSNSLNMCQFVGTVGWLIIYGHQSEQE